MTSTVTRAPIVARNIAPTSSFHVSTAPFHSCKRMIVAENTYMILWQHFNSWILRDFALRVIRLIVKVLFCQLPVVALVTRKLLKLSACSCCIDCTPRHPNAALHSLHSECIRAKNNQDTVTDVFNT